MGRIGEIEARLADPESRVGIWDDHSGERTWYVTVSPTDLEWVLGEIWRLRAVIEAAEQYVAVKRELFGPDYTGMGLEEYRMYEAVDALSKALKGGDANESDG